MIGKVSILLYWRYSCASSGLIASGFIQRAPCVQCLLPGDGRYPVQTSVPRRPFTSRRSQGVKRTTDIRVSPEPFIPCTRSRQLSVFVKIRIAAMQHKSVNMHKLWLFYGSPRISQRNISAWSCTKQENLPSVWRNKMTFVADEMQSALLFQSPLPRLSFVAMPTKSFNKLSTKSATHNYTRDHLCGRRAAGRNMTKWY